MIYLRIAFLALALGLSVLLWTGASASEEPCVTAATSATSSANYTPAGGEQQSGITCR